MGLFSGIKKAFKKIFKGVKKVFKKVGKEISRFAKSDFGKAILIAAAVVTGGAALMAGAGAFGASAAAGGGFVTNFVAGAQGFMAGLASPIATIKGIGAAATAGTSWTAGAAQGAGALNFGAASVENVIKNHFTDGGLSARELASKKLGEEALKQGGEEVVKKGLLEKAADYAFSPGGGIIIGNLLQGYGQGKAAEEQAKARRRALDRFASPETAAWHEEKAQGLLNDLGGPGAGGGILTRIRRRSNSRFSSQQPQQQQPQQQPDYMVKY